MFADITSICMLLPGQSKGVNVGVDVLVIAGVLVGVDAILLLTVGLLVGPGVIPGVDVLVTGGVFVGVGAGDFVGVMVGISKHG